MADDPPSIDWQAPCDLCGQPASWRSIPKAAEVEFTARVVHCPACRFTFIDPSKAQPAPSRRESAIGWIAERIAG